MSYFYKIGFILYGAGVAVSDIGVGGEGGYVAVENPDGTCHLYYFVEFTSGLLGGCYIAPEKPVDTTYLPNNLESFFVHFSIGSGIAVTGTAKTDFIIYNKNNYEVFTFKEKPLQLRGVCTSSLDVTAKLKRDYRFIDKPLKEMDYSKYLTEVPAGKAFEKAMGRMGLMASK
jgi:hypothetical protein